MTAPPRPGRFGDHGDRDVPEAVVAAPGEHATAEVGHTRRATSARGLADGSRGRA